MTTGKNTTEPEALYNLCAIIYGLQVSVIIRFCKILRQTWKLFTISMWIICSCLHVMTLESLGYTLLSHKAVMTISCCHIKQSRQSVDGPHYTNLSTRVWHSRFVVSLLAANEPHCHFSWSFLESPNNSSHVRKHFQFLLIMTRKTRTSHHRKADLSAHHHFLSCREELRTLAQRLLLALWVYYSTNTTSLKRTTLWSEAPDNSQKQTIWCPWGGEQIKSKRMKVIILRK